MSRQVIIRNWFSPKLEKIILDLNPPNISYLEEWDIDEWQEHGLTVVGCKGIEPHTDRSFPQYSIMVIWYNKGMIAKGTNQDLRNWLKQKPGVILILDIHERHHCIPDIRLMPCDDTSWVAFLVKECRAIEEIPTKTEIESILIEKLPCQILNLKSIKPLSVAKLER